MTTTVAALPVRYLAWRKFHVDNSDVFDIFKRFAVEAFESGRERLGSRIIAERMRWYTLIETQDVEGWKLNNNHIPYYTHLLMYTDDRFADFFELRPSRFDATREMILDAHRACLDAQKDSD